MTFAKAVIGLLCMYAFCHSIQTDATTIVTPKIKSGDQLKFEISIDGKTACKFDSSAADGENKLCRFNVKPGSAKLLLNGHLIRDNKKHGLKQRLNIFDLAILTKTLTDSTQSFTNRLSEFERFYNSFIKRHSKSLARFVLEEHGVEESMQGVLSMYPPLVTRKNQTPSDIDASFKNAEKRLGHKLDEELKEIVEFDFTLGYGGTSLLSPSQWRNTFASQLQPRGWDELSLLDRFGDKTTQSLMHSIVLFLNEGFADSTMWLPSKSGQGQYISINGSELNDLEYWQKDSSILNGKSVVLSLIYNDIAERLVNEFAQAKLLDVETENWGGLTSDYLMLDSSHVNFQVTLFFINDNEIKPVLQSNSNQLVEIEN